MTIGFVAILLVSVGLSQFTSAHPDYFSAHDLDIATHLWASSLNIGTNTSLNIIDSVECSHCGEFFYHEPPPGDILFLPPPPPHPFYESSPLQVAGSGSQLDSKQTHEEQPCNFCSFFYNEGEKLNHDQDVNIDSDKRIIATLIAFISISGLLLVYLVTTRRNKIMASLTRTRLFESGGRTTGALNAPLPNGKNNSINESLSNAPGVHIADPCFIHTNRDKNLTSPIINDHVSHKKTSIPSKYWAQPGSIIGRTIRRIPNEYEIPSSRSNSTGTSSAVYADMVNHEHSNQRLFSPYNMHTYAEVREVLDPNENFHTSSNSSAMMSESNYDNAAYSHGGCMVTNTGAITSAPDGSVQMSDFNSMRPMPPMSGYGQAVPFNNHIYPGHRINQAKMIQGQNGQQTIYEQPQRAQVIITSNNQGVNPTLLNYKDRVHNVI